jgi:acetyltransferase-like isoleucine patch superfamily enzyme
VKKVAHHEKTRFRLSDGSKSGLKKYQEMTVGNQSFFRLIQFELFNSLIGNFPGAMGFILRRLFYPALFQKIGNGVILGRGISLRSPHRIKIGRKVAIDEGCLIDARGAGDTGVSIADDVIIGRHCAIQAKYGPIRIGKKTSIGPQCVMSAASEITLGSHLAIAAHCYIGGGFYHFERTDIPIIEQGVYSRGALTIEDDVWIGAGAIILDNVSIGKGSVVGAGSVVTHNLPEYTISAGVPARVIRQR